MPRAIVVAALVLLALVLRVVFVVRLPTLPLYWDELHYDAWAYRYASAWRALWKPGTALPQFRSAFVSSLPKGEAYSAFVGLTYALVGTQVRSIFLIQAVLDACSCFFVYRIAHRLGGSTVGMATLALAAVYQPFIFASGRLQTETVCMTVLLGALWAYLGRGRRETLALAVAGLLVALTMLVRPAFQFLFPVMLAMIPLARWDEPRSRQLRAAGAFAAGFFVLIGPRLLLTYALTGTPAWSGTSDPGTNAYAGIVFENLGWKTDRLAFLVPPRGELLAVMQGRPGEHATEEDCRRAFTRQWINHPRQSVLVVLHKVYQLWLHPYNDSRRTLGVSLTAQRRWHQLMLILAAIGTPLAFRNWPVAVPLAAITLYSWVTYVGMQIEVRYMIDAFPLLLCFAAIALTALATGLARSWRERNVRLATLVAVLFAGLFLVRLVTIPRALAWFAGLPLGVAHTGRTIAMLLLLALCAGALFEILRGAAPRSWAAAASGVAAIIAVVLFVGGRPLASSWRTWSAPLVGNDDVVRQEITIPADVTPPAVAELKMDLVATPGAGDLVVLVNGVEARRFVGGPKRDDAVPLEDHDLYSQIFAAQERPQQPWHAWYAVPLPPESIVPGGSIQVELRIDGAAAGSGAVRVFGDYPVEGTGIYDGPSIISPESDADRSVYRYIAEGDFRMRRRTEIPATGRSSLVNGGIASTFDLSADPGRQYGRYRIFLLLIYENITGKVF